MDKDNDVPRRGDGAVGNVNASDSEYRKWKGENVDVVMTMQKGIFDHGRNRAISSGTDEPVQSDIDAITEHATAMAEETYRPAFDPENNLDDRLKADQFGRDEKALTEAELGLKHANAELSGRKDDEAKVKTKVPKEPEFPTFIACFAIVMIALTIAPSLHDTLFINFSNDWAWFLAIAAGVAWGAFVAYAILDGGRRSSKGTRLSQLGLIAAIGMAIALGIIRLMTATEATDYLLAVGFTLLEIFIAIGLESVARSYFEALEEYSRFASVAVEALELVNNSVSQVANRKSEVNRLSERINRFISYVAERKLRSTSKAELVASAIKAGMDGYNDGIEFNRGKLRGINR